MAGARTCGPPYGPGRADDGGHPRVARIAGETAPVLFNAGGNDKFNWNPFSGQQDNLPLRIYELIFQPGVNVIRDAWGVSFVLVLLVLILFVLARLVGRSRPGKRLDPPPEAFLMSRITVLASSPTTEDSCNAHKSAGESTESPIQKANVGSLLGLVVALVTLVGTVVIVPRGICATTTEPSPESTSATTVTSPPTYGNGGHLELAFLASTPLGSDDSTSEARQQPPRSGHRSPQRSWSQRCRIVVRGPGHRNVSTRSKYSPLQPEHQLHEHVFR